MARQPRTTPAPASATSRPMDFGRALELLKVGAAVARTGWNGSGMFVYLVPGSLFRIEAGRPLAAFWPAGMPHAYQSHLDLYTGKLSVPWTASQTDLLAEDWVKVNVPQSATLTHPEPQAPPARKLTVKIPAKAAGKTAGLPKGSVTPAAKGGVTPKAKTGTTLKAPVTGKAPAAKTGKVPPVGKVPPPTKTPPPVRAPVTPPKGRLPPGLPAGGPAGLPDLGNQGGALPVPPPGRRIPPGAVVPPSPLPAPVPPADISNPNIGIPPT